MPDRRYATFLAVAPDAVVIIDDDGIIEYLNEQAEYMFRYRREQLMGRPIETLLPERFRQRHVDHRSEYIDDPRRRSMGEGFELYGLRSDNVEFAVDISLAPIESDEGVRYAAAIRDVTAQKQAVVVISQTIARTTEWLHQLDHALGQLSPGVRHTPHP